MARESLLNYIESINPTGTLLSNFKTFLGLLSTDTLPSAIESANASDSTIASLVNTRILFSGDGHIITQGKDILGYFARLSNEKSLTLSFGNNTATYKPFSGSNITISLDTWLASLVTEAMHYRGTVNSSTATPTTKVKGDFYKVNGVTNNTIFGINGTTSSPAFEWSVGDAIVYNGSSWDRIPSGDSKWAPGSASSLSWTASTTLGTIDGVTVSVPKLPSISSVVSAAASTDVVSTTKGKFTIGTVTIGGTTTTFLGKDTTYTFSNGTAGNFTVTPVGGSALTVSIGKPATAGTADTALKVTYALSTGTGLTMGTTSSTANTYNGSVAREISLVTAGANILGGVKVAAEATSNLHLDSTGNLSLTQSGVLNALGKTLTLITNSWRPITINGTSLVTSGPNNGTLNFVSTESGIFANSQVEGSGSSAVINIGFSLAWYNISTGSYEFPAQVSDVNQGGSIQ